MSDFAEVLLFEVMRGHQDRRVIASAVGVLEDTTRGLAAIVEGLLRRVVVVEEGRDALVAEGWRVAGDAEIESGLFDLQFVTLRYIAEREPGLFEVDVDQLIRHIKVGTWVRINVHLTDKLPPLRSLTGIARLPLVPLLDRQVRANMQVLLGDDLVTEDHWG